MSEPTTTTASPKVNGSAIEQAIALTKDKEKDKKRVHLFTFTYKKGPVNTTNNIRAIDEKDAEEQIARYLKFLSAQHNGKIILYGRIKPFALDVDEEIETYNQRQKREGGSPYVEHPNSIIQPRIMA